MRRQTPARAAISSTHRAHCPCWRTSSPIMRSTASSLTVNLHASEGGIGPEAARCRRRAIVTGRLGACCSRRGGKIEGRPAGKAHRLDLAAEDASTGVQALGQGLGIIVGYGTGREALPDRAGEVIEAGERARAVNRGGHLVAKGHAFPAALHG